MAGHYSEDDLVLYYYGEGRRRAAIERHLDACTECRTSLRAIADTLRLVGEPPIPERGDDYGTEVWQRLRHRVPDAEPHTRVFWFGWLAPNRLALAGAAALVIVAAFAAGRLLPRSSPAPTAGVAAAAGATSGERVRIDALGDHLERSERLLVDLANDDGGSADIGVEQAWATDLVAANRLYRDAAVRAGDTATAQVLDELERNLLDIIHAPSPVNAQELAALRTRLEAAALLFKVRVLHDELRGREGAPATPSRNRNIT